MKLSSSTSTAFGSSSNKSFTHVASIWERNLFSSETCSGCVTPQTSTLTLSQAHMLSCDSWDWLMFRIYLLINFDKGNCREDRTIIPVRQVCSFWCVDDAQNSLWEKFSSVRGFFLNWTEHAPETKKSNKTSGSNEKSTKQARCLFFSLQKNVSARLHYCNDYAVKF